MTEPTDNGVAPRHRETQISLRALEYLTRRPGEVVFIDDIADTTGFTQKQIVNALGYLRAKRDTLGQEIKVIVAGKAWQYLPNQGYTKPITAEPPSVPAPAAPRWPVPAAPTPAPVQVTPPTASPKPKAVRRRRGQNQNGDLYEQISLLEDGSVLLKDGNEVVYIARKLQI